MRSDIGQPYLNLGVIAPSLPTELIRIKLRDSLFRANDTFTTIIALILVPQV